MAIDISRRSLFLAASAGRIVAAETGHRYELGCATLPYRALPIGRALEGIRRAGYRYILPFSTHDGKEVFTPSLTEAGRAELRRRFSDEGLEANLCYAGLGMNAAKPETVEIFLKELDLAREFGIRLVVGVGPSYFTHFPNIPKRAADWQRDCELFYPALERAVRHAESIGVTIAVKPHTGVTATAKACLEVLRRVRSERLKICWDAGNVSFYEGIWPDPDLPELVPSLRAVCLKDHKGLRGDANFPIPGQGQIDHPALFRTLFAGGFRGPLYIERIDGTDNAMKMAPELIDQRLELARRLMAPLLEKASQQEAG